VAFSSQLLSPERTLQSLCQAVARVSSRLNDGLINAGSLYCGADLGLRPRQGAISPGPYRQFSSTLPAAPKKYFA
jgi:hypothetical protein